MRESKKKEKLKKGKDPLLGLKDSAIKTGIKDIAEHHDYYFYGVTK